MPSHGDHASDGARAAAGGGNHGEQVEVYVGPEGRLVRRSSYGGGGISPSAMADLRRQIEEEQRAGK